MLAAAAAVSWERDDRERVHLMCAPGGRVNARQGLDPPHRL
jgi:hypothetical protein